jgi:hypothetical protein
VPRMKTPNTLTSAMFGSARSSRDNSYLKLKKLSNSPLISVSHTQAQALAIISLMVL